MYLNDNCYLKLQSAITLIALAVVASASDPYKPAPFVLHERTKPVQSYKHSPSYKEPTYKDTPPKYEYKYGVDAQDGYKGYVQFDANEARDGYSTYGSFRVLLPDGRTKIVSYKTADAYSGNVMDVKYEGKASYAPSPVHKAASSYKPAPTYHA